MWNIEDAPEPLTYSLKDLRQGRSVSFSCSYTILEHIQRKSFTRVTSSFLELFLIYFSPHCSTSSSYTNFLCTSKFLVGRDVMTRSRESYKSKQLVVICWKDVTAIAQVGSLFSFKFYWSSARRWEFLIGFTRRRLTRKFSCRSWRIRH